MNHRGSGYSERGHSRWRDERQSSWPSSRGHTRFDSSDDAQRRDYGSDDERSAQRYGAQMSDEDWPDPTHNYDTGRFGGGFDRSGDERRSGGYGRESAARERGNRSVSGNDDRSGAYRGSERGYRSDFESGDRSRPGYRHAMQDDYGSRNYGDDRSSIYGSGRGDYGTERYGRADDDAQGYGGMRGGHRGRGPKNYTRSDDRIKEDINERLYEDDFIDASDVTVEVSDGIVTLDGSVGERWVKHRVEDIAGASSGVKDVTNHLRVSSNDNNRDTMRSDSGSSGSRGTGSFTGSTGNTQTNT
jgi:osmotically-inducible protein OsmY